MITLILLGKPMCERCERVSKMLKQLECKYTVKRVNILSLFEKDGIIHVLGMKMYELITSLGEKFGDEYVLLLKYNPETQEMGLVKDFKRFAYICQIDASVINYMDLNNTIENSRYGKESFSDDKQ
ncbi:glutaredoxin-like protein [Cetacean poxvirus 1]|nr:glutaredoxin-like protein [Cetacean poxvirus 1]